MSANDSMNLEKVLKNLGKEIKEIEGYTLKGLINAAIDIRQSMAHNPPTVPVDTGNLRSSFFIVTSKGQTKSGGSPNFKGEKADELASNHGEVVEKSTAEISGSVNPTVMLGFSANYAIYVHEKYGAHFRRPGAGAGFLVSAINSNKAKILEDIKDSVKIK